VETINRYRPQCGDLGLESVLTTTTPPLPSPPPPSDNDGGPFLTELDCSFLPHITDEGLRVLLETQPRLHTLRLQGCQSITGEGFCCEGQKGGVVMRRGLTYVDMSSCPSLAQGVCYW